MTTRTKTSKTWGGKLLAACLLLLAGLPPAGAAAVQRTYRPPRVYNPNVYSRTRQTMSSRAAVRAGLERKKQSSGRAGTTGSRPPASPTSTPARTPAAGTATFRPVAASIMPRQMAVKLGDTPEEQRRLERMFSDLLENYRDRLKQANAPLNDVSRAAAYLVTASYAISQNERVQLDDAQLAGLRKYLSQVFSEDETFQRMSDRERQELFEDYGITATWIDVGYNIVKQAGDGEAMRQWREMARQNFVGVIGAQPEQVVFTADGVRYK